MGVRNSGVRVRVGNNGWPKMCKRKSERVKKQWEDVDWMEGCKRPASFFYLSSE